MDDVANCDNNVDKHETLFTRCTLFTLWFGMISHMLCISSLCSSECTVQRRDRTERRTRSNVNGQKNAPGTERVLPRLLMRCGKRRLQYYASSRPGAEQARERQGTSCLPPVGRRCSPLLRTHEIYFMITDQKYLVMVFCDVINMINKNPPVDKRVSYL